MLSITTSVPLNKKTINLASFYNSFKEWLSKIIKVHNNIQMDLKIKWCNHYLQITVPHLKMIQWRCFKNFLNVPKAQASGYLPNSPTPSPTNYYN